MSAALKMAAPGELSSQIKKLMVFCDQQARSVKAMKHHLAVTESTTRDLLAQALEQKLLWKQSNGMYKTIKTKLAFVETVAEQPAVETPSSIAASAVANEPKQADSLQDLSELDHSFDVIEINDDMAAAIDAAYEEQQAAYTPKPAPAASSEFDLEQMQQEFEQLQNRNSYPVIDDVNAKVRALQLCSLLLSDSSTEIKRCIEAIQMDLAVINLHQLRS